MRFLSAAFALVPLALALLVHAPAARADALEDDLGGLTDEQLEDTVTFTIGNSLFFLFHEAGHMLISEFGLPVLGREEDAVDTLSSLLLLAADDEMFDQALVDSVDGWNFSSAWRIENGEEEDLSGAHALDEQRAYNIACMMIGKDAERYQDTADYMELSEDRRGECAFEYQQAHDSWFGVLEPHVRSDDAASRFEVSYEDVSDPDLAGYAELVETSQMLEVLREILAAYELEDDIRLTARECGEANAYWSPEDREITYCYELARDYTQYIADYFRNPEE